MLAVLCPPTVAKLCASCPAPNRVLATSPSGPATGAVVEGGPAWLRRSGHGLSACEGERVSNAHPYLHRYALNTPHKVSMECSECSRYYYVHHLRIPADPGPGK